MGSSKSEISGTKSTKVSAAKADWEKTVDAVSGLFGKLVYLAGLRDDSTGNYRHYGFSRRYSDELTSTILSATHEEIFSEWLTMSIEQQRSDIEEHWREQGSDPNLIVENWLILEPYRRLIPASRPSGGTRPLFVRHRAGARRHSARGFLRLFGFLGAESSGSGTPSRGNCAA